MKRILAVSLVFLFLTGCAQQPNTATTVPTTEVVETTAPGLYVEDSDVEQQTGGAVRRFMLPTDSFCLITMMGDKILLAEGGETSTLTVLTGIDLFVSTTMQIPLDLSAEDAIFRVIHDGFIWYDRENRQMLFLDQQLQQREVISMPEDMEGDPVISDDGDNIYYCTPGQIRAFDVENRITRPIKTHECNSQAVLHSAFGGSVLCCRIENTEGNVNIYYISADNGQTIAMDSTVGRLATFEDRFLMQRVDGVTPQNIIGLLNEAPVQLNVDGEIEPALELGGVVAYTATENGISLDFYDVPTGTRTATVSFDGYALPQSILADRWSRCIWLVAADAQTGEKSLLQWDPEKSAVEDQTAPIGTIYTADAPDEVGLAACQSRVDALNKTHGTTIRIWEKATASGNGHVLEAEHQVGITNYALDVIEQTLVMFPKNFLYNSVNNRIRICLVRSVDHSIKTAYYWYEGDPFIVLSSGVNIQTELLKGLGYVIESHIQGNTSALDNWDGLNPEGFAYGDESTYSELYLQGDTLAFATKEAMTSAKEDLSVLFCYAMLPDNAEMFRSEIMQQKLLIMCNAIRESWRLQWKSDVYHWEQYLNESIAY